MLIKINLLRKAFKSFRNLSEVQNPTKILLYDFLIVQLTVHVSHTQDSSVVNLTNELTIIAI